MRLLANAAMAAMLMGPSSFASGQNQSAAPQNSQDVPQQKPGGTNNPDIGRQQPTGTSSKDTSQKKADVPKDAPGAGHPGMRKQRQPIPKKSTKDKSNTSTT